MSKFKIGETIFSMESNKPAQHVIEGISKLEGKVNSLRSWGDVNLPEGEVQINYHSGYTTIKEDDAFSSLEDLKNSLFK